MNERKFASTLIRDSEDKLGLTPEQVSQLLADANTSLAKTKYMTEIDGGLIYSAMMKLYDAGGTGDEKAGISGVAGVDKDAPAFWAGGTYDQAIGGTAKAIIRHDGTSKFTDAEITGTVNAKSGSIGVLDVDTSGQVKLEEPDTGNTRLSFIKSKIPFLADLLSTTNFGGSITATGTSISFPSSGSSTSYLSGSLNVSKNASTISITGGATISLIGHLDDGVSVDLVLYLTRDGVEYQALEFLHIFGESNTVDDTVKSTTVKGVPSGNYRLMLEVTVIGSGGAIGYGNVGDIPMSWSFQQSGVRNFLFGLNGFLSFFSDRHIYFSEEHGFDLRGKTNMPGVLAKGRISEGGVRDVTKAWGDKYSTSTITKPSGTGSYSIPVNCKNGDYDVNISPRTANRTFHIGVTTATYFEVFFRDQNGNAANSEFSYTLVGNNY